MTFSTDALRLLKDLRDNNNREWFAANRAEFKREVESPFIDMIEALTTRFETSDPQLLGSHKTMFRMNRDTRFSKDKTPYKTQIAGTLTPTGTKGSDGVLYFHLGADAGFAAAGFYMLSPAALKPMRTIIADDPERFGAVLASLKSAGRRLGADHALTSMPRGFERYADHPHAPALRLKSFVVSEPIPHAAWRSGDAIARIETLGRDALPLLRFGLEAMRGG